MMEKPRNMSQIFVGKPEGKKSLGDLGVYGRMLWTDAAQGSVADSRERGNEPSGTIKG
jgi:hypothetical protein